jgi:hypothetical protein
MAKIPIEIEKIKKTYRSLGFNENTEYEKTEYLISVTKLYFNRIIHRIILLK